MRPEDYNISKELLTFKEQDGNIHDQKLDTKPVGYFKDAFNRFKRNKASIVATIIIGILILFAIIVPIFSNYRVSYAEDSHYPIFQNALPKSGFTDGIDFWDGCKENSVTADKFYEYMAIYTETGNKPIKNNEYKTVTTGKGAIAAMQKTYYVIREDSYYKKGVISKLVNEEEYLDIQKYQNETGIQVIYPAIADSKVQASNANMWYKTDAKNKVVWGSGGAEELDFIPNYAEYNGKDDYNSIRIAAEGDTPKWNYAYKKDGSYEVRVSYYDYYCFYNKTYYDDGVTKPVFMFGTTDAGQDILTCLASGARFSLILSVIVASVNLIVGAIIGAIEGYYGGAIDLIIERIIDILGSIPFMIVITLLKYHLKAGDMIVLFISFFITGWTGMASRTRMQFYRFKNQEYVLVARTLGASDSRIMFKHIFPNAIGTLITGSVLVIPSVIFSETSLSYLGIINLESGNLISVGTLLGKGNSTTLISAPHVILFPALFISLLMLSFNLFGNGLRDAFNPSLRGTED